MQSILKNFGVFIVLGVIAVVAALMGPSFLEKRCSDQWAPREVTWHFQTGCMVKFGNLWVPEANISR